MSTLSPAVKSIRIMALMLGLALVLLSVKFGAYFLTNSNAILTDALESIINFVTGGVALYSVFLAAKPKDQDHPYGHGKIEFISSGLEGSLITLAGVAIIFKSVYNLLHPQPIQKMDVGIVLTLGAGVVNYAAGRYLVHRGTKHHSLTIIANGKHLLSDAYTSLGLVIGLGCIYFTQILWLDSVVAIIFGSFITYTGYGIVRNSISGVMDEADHQLLERIITVLNQRRRENWIDLHNMRVIKYGSMLHIDSHLTLPWYFNLQEGHKEVELLQEIITQEMGDIVELFVHLDPCLPPHSCRLCTKSDCHVREHDFVSRVEWSLENVIEDEKHSL
ncbi:cation diffusion facilitator family transporter [Rufibacter tibetensis]|uniref:Cation diffusion facilitator family transporter n=1 Tax=Rufibacter tibetensis TaxID=512763 RepID=A0A0P0CX45_9BACT|nr:cation diffusion facilitator family transporter [Rufibacter tibetensis]ALI99961.1 cation diffusion facilitator family transporter [Rufibacter tibetensis]